MQLCSHNISKYTALKTVVWVLIPDTHGTKFISTVRAELP